MLRSLEDRLNKKFSQFFEHKLDMLDEAIGNKLTSFFSAPSKVPEPAPLGVLGGESTDSLSREQQVDRTPGVVPQSNQDPPPHNIINPVYVDSLARSGSVGVGVGQLQGRDSLANLGVGRGIDASMHDVTRNFVPTSSAPSDFLFSPFSSNPVSSVSSSSAISSSSFSVSAIMSSAASPSIYSLSLLPLPFLRLRSRNLTLPIIMLGFWACPSLIRNSLALVINPIYFDSVSRSGSIG